jgi:hypothetical protein
VGEFLVSGFHLLVVLVHLVREDPRIGEALAVLLIAGIVVAILIRKMRSAEFPTLK